METKLISGRAECRAGAIEEAAVFEVVLEVDVVQNAAAQQLLPEGHRLEPVGRPPCGRPLLWSGDNLY